MYSKKRVIFIFAVCYIAYLTTYIARQNLSTATPLLDSQSIYDLSHIGILGSIFFVTYSTGRLFFGRLSDSIKPKYLLGAGLILICISNFVFGLFPPFGVSAVMWGINALGQSFMWGSILQVMSGIFDSDRVVKFTAYIATTTSSGVIIGMLIATGVIKFTNLHFAFFVPAAIALIMAVLTFFTVKDIGTTKKEASVHISLKEIFADDELSASILPALIHGVMKDNVNLWMSAYFVSRFAVDLEKSAIFVFFIPAIGFLGRIVSPHLLRLLKSSQKVCTLAFFCCGIGSAALVLIRPTENSVLLPIVAAAALGLISAAISVINTCMISYLPLRFSAKGASGQVSGIMDFVTYMGAGIGSAVYGYVLKHFDYSYMYASWIAICAICIILPFVKNKINKFSKKY